LVNKLEFNNIFFFTTVKLFNSTDVQVVLQSVNLASSGRYRCEISGEAPMFQTVSDTGDMVVVGMCNFSFILTYDEIQH